MCVQEYKGGVKLSVRDRGSSDVISLHVYNLDFFKKNNSYCAVTSPPDASPLVRAAAEGGAGSGRAALKLLHCLGYPVVWGGGFSEGFIYFDSVSSPSEGVESSVDIYLQFQGFS